MYITDKYAYLVPSNKCGGTYQKYTIVGLDPIDVHRLYLAINIQKMYTSKTTYSA